jgi:hypothetical protein
VKQPASSDSAGVLRQAIDFFETAIRNGTKPADVARSALSMFPKPQLETIANADVRAVLAEIEREVGPDRVISSPAGKEFLKGMQQSIREMLKTKTA